GLTPLDRFLQHATLVTTGDALDPNADAVTLMTMHNAKGLEFRTVFITGLEDGLFPLAKAFDDPPLLEEERRLFYVGITRAERRLFLSHAEERRRNGELMASRQSSFLDSIPDGMIEKRGTIKVRSSGRSMMRAGGNFSAYGRSYGQRGRIGEDFEDVPPRPSPAARRPGMPVPAYASVAAAEDESQDAPVYAP